MGRWAGVWWGLVALLFTLSLGIPSLADSSFCVVVASGSVLLGALLALRKAVHAGWSEDVDDFAEGLAAVTEAMDGAAILAITSGRDRPPWRTLIRRVPWPSLGTQGESTGLGTWYAAHSANLTEDQRDLFAILGQFETHLHKGSTNLARRKMRTVADSWSDWHYIPGFRAFFREKVLPYYGDFIKLLAYVEIQHATTTRAHPTPSGGWVKIGRRWDL